jgi:5-methylcytosine-specific restriction endonuclease McrA
MTYRRQRAERDVVAGVARRRASTTTTKRSPSARLSQTYGWAQLRKRFYAECRASNAPCWRCGQPIDYAAAPRTPDAFEADHFKPVATHPHLAYEYSNLRPSHCSCNRKRGHKIDAVEDNTTWIPADW